MPRCRCQEISQGQSEYSKLTGMVKCMVDDAKHFNSKVSPKLQSASQNFSSSINPSSASGVESALCGLNQQLDGSSRGLLDQYYGATDRLSGLLSSWRSDDKAYHAAQASM